MSSAHSQLHTRGCLNMSITDGAFKLAIGRKQSGAVCWSVGLLASAHGLPSANLLLS
jgi:hypothetical protein